MKRNRITFDFDGEHRESYEKLVHIICSSHWRSSIDIFGLTDKSHNLLVDFVKLGVIIIDECEYEAQEPFADNEKSQSIEIMLGKRNSHPVLHDIASLFAMNPLSCRNITATQFTFPTLKRLRGRTVCNRKI